MILTPAEWVGTAGVSMLLTAFVLLQLNRIDKVGLIYLSLNTVGAALACLSSYMIDFFSLCCIGRRMGGVIVHRARSVAETFQSRGEQLDKRLHNNKRKVRRAV